MSKHQQWKMLHLLYNYAHRSGDARVLTEAELTNAGVYCDPDSREPLEEAGLVTWHDHAYALTPAARKMLETFTVAKARTPASTSGSTIPRCSS
jgi:hypothetical protein